MNTLSTLHVWAGAECRVVAGHKLPDTGCWRLRRPMEQTAQTLRGADAGWSLAVATPALVPGIFNGRRAGAQGAGWGTGGCLLLLLLQMSAED